MGDQYRNKMPRARVVIAGRSSAEGVFGGVWEGWDQPMIVEAAHALRLARLLAGEKS